MFHEVSLEQFRFANDNFFVTDEVIDIFEIFLENKYICNFY